MLPVLILITTDPARSSAPAEGVRIAAALCGWGQLQVTICLQGPASRLLADPATPAFERQLQTLSQLAGPIYMCEAEAVEQPEFATEELTITELARRAAKCKYVLRF